jgi:hypothetical protein
MKLRTIVLGFVLFYSYFLNAQYSDCILKNVADTAANEIKFDFNQRTEKFGDYLAYSGKFFPELKGCKIEVRRKKITTMMAARPKRNFLLHPQRNRKYVLLITDKYNMNADSIYNTLSNCATIGVFGHELSHIVDYSKKSNAELLFFGIKYYLDRKKIESYTDLLAIEHGFGPGLVEYTHFIHHSPLVNKKYLSRKNKYYLSATELESKMH